ncbi:MAG: hypothetical protein ACRDJE_18620, partial [Dehalococcoidia bacterium]
MAETTNIIAIRYVQGDLVEPDPEMLEREARSRDRTGVAQIERVMRGEEVAAAVTPRRVASRALDVSSARAPTAEMKIPPGSVVGHPTVDVRARDKVTGRAIYSVDTY